MAEHEIYKALMDIKEEQGRQSAVLSATYEQAKKTNGRVTKLEKRVTQMEKAPKIEVKHADVVKGKPVIQQIFNKEMLALAVFIAAGVGYFVITILEYLQTL
ncbi:hypothetical protein ACMA5I_10295 [Paracoccaceae bacterium GXU_MW_L88]